MAGQPIRHSVPPFLGLPPQKRLRVEWTFSPSLEKRRLCHTFLANEMEVESSGGIWRVFKQSRMETWHGNQSFPVCSYSSNPATTGERPRESTDTTQPPNSCWQSGTTRFAALGEKSIPWSLFANLSSGLQLGTPGLQEEEQKAGPIQCTPPGQLLLNNLYKSTHL